MESLIVLLALLSLFAAPAPDPSSGIFQSKEDARNLECTRLSQAEAHERFPAQVPESPPRGNHGGIDALVCAPQIMRAGDRLAQDEAVLSTLRRSVGEITQLASALGGSELTWHVDAFYPRPQVASKISVAARTELA